MAHCGHKPACPSSCGCGLEVRDELERDGEVGA